jgi:hypothetical protein
LAIFSLVQTLVVHMTECFIFKTAPFGFYIIFPGLLNSNNFSGYEKVTNINQMFVFSVITLVGLSLAPKYLHRVDELIKSCGDDENTELLRNAGNFRRRRHNRKNQ